MAVNRTPATDTGLPRKIIDFPQVKVDSGPFFQRTVAEEFFESLDTIFMQSLYRRLAGAKANACLGEQGAAKHVDAIALQIEMRLRQREAIRSSVVSKMTRWRRDEMDLKFGTAGLFGECAASLCRTEPTATNRSRRKIDAARKALVALTR